MIAVDKACACVLRDGHLLCFRHPSAGNQLPKGTVEAGESSEAAVVRELAEESGLTQAQVIGKICQYERIVGGDGHSGVEARHRWHLFHLAVPGAPRAPWRHRVRSDGVDDGMVFEYFWQDLAQPITGFHPIFVQAISAVQGYLARV